jgi:hypothetical protein
MGNHAGRGESGPEDESGEQCVEQKVAALEILGDHRRTGQHGRGDKADDGRDDDRAGSAALHAFFGVPDGLHPVATEDRAGVLD